MEFPELIRLTRRVGPDIPLLSELTKLKQDEILSLLSRIKSLSFTPIPANRFMKLKFSSRIYTRKSVKTDFSFLFDKEGVEVVRFENFSGIPETYDYDTDTWNYDGSIKATPLVHDFQYEGEVEPIDFSTLRSPKSMTDVLREANSKGLIQSYVVDYGSREFLLDVITLNPEVKEAFQYFPFIRFVAHLRGDEATFYLIELFMPEAHLREVAEALEEVRDQVKILFAPRSFKYVRRV